jgi:enolase
VTEIIAVTAFEALDSRGRPTVACRVDLARGARGRAIVPSGASTGSHEARELRDGGERYGGSGVRAAVIHVEGALADAVVGLDALDQAAVDGALRAADGTADLARLGANAVLAVSVASARAAAASVGVELHELVAAGAPPLLPMPMVNIVSGGAHAARSVDVQDFLVVPVGASTFAECIEWASRVRRATAEEVADRGLVWGLVADEGGLGPALPGNRAALELLATGIERSGLRAGVDVAIAIDVAATQFVRADGDYDWIADSRRLSRGELIEELASWVSAFPILSIEDALAEDDWDGWRDATERLAGIQVLGDDLFVTSPARLERGIASGVANAVLVKPNQVGTLSDAREVVRIAHAADYATVLSARSGETEDDWLADLAVGWRTGQIKVGSTTRSERTAKWNRLLEIERDLDAPLAPFPPR